MVDGVAEAAAPKKAPKTAPAAAAAAPAAPEVKFEFPKFELPKFEIPKFEMPKFDVAAPEVPAVVREMAEKAVAQAQAGYAKLKTAAEEATDVLEDTYETARAGALEYNSKALDAAKTNADAMFGFAKDLMSVKTVSEAVELQTAFARKSFETLTAQMKDLQATAQKVATETSKPVKDATEKAMKDFKAA